MRVFRFQQLTTNCIFARREKFKQHYRILREVDINITITKTTINRINITCKCKIFILFYTLNEAK